MEVISCLDKALHDKIFIVQQRKNTRYFLLFRKFFDIDQYNFGIVLLSNTLPDRLE